MSLDGIEGTLSRGIRKKDEELILHAKAQKSWEHWYCTGHLDWSVKSVMRANLVLKAQYKCNSLIKNSPMYTIMCMLKPSHLCSDVQTGEKDTEA